MIRRSPDIVAAIVNGGVVLLVPLVFVAWATWAGLAPTDTRVVVRPPGTSGVAGVAERLAYAGAVLLPLAMLAAWRTSVYARRVLARQEQGWRAVGEAVACAMVPVLAIALPGSVTRPVTALYVLAYGGGVAALVGLVVGITLRTTALLTLRLYARNA